MAKIPEVYSFGDQKDITPERLVIILADMYKTLAVAINRKPDVYQRPTDGQASDYRLYNGDLNINTATLKVQMLTSHDTSATVTWGNLT
jgi:hypothetical protein